MAVRDDTCPWCSQTFEALFKSIEDACEEMGRKAELSARVYTIVDDDYEGWTIRDMAYCGRYHTRKSK